MVAFCHSLVISGGPDSDAEQIEELPLVHSEAFVIAHVAYGETSMKTEVGDHWARNGFSRGTDKKTESHFASTSCG